MSVIQRIMYYDVDTLLWALLITLIECIGALEVVTNTQTSRKICLTPCSVSQGALQSLHERNGTLSTFYV